MQPLQEIKSYLGWKVDYLNPPGEPAFAGPDSVSWQVFKNPIALAIGGVAAVLLEFADARIRSGVWDHSVFKTDPIGRSKRTGVAAMVGVYGPQAAARRVIQGVTNMHARKVQGTTPKGEAYKALDVELLDWVSATAGFGFLTAYDRFVKPVSEADKDGASSRKAFRSRVSTACRIRSVRSPISTLRCRRYWPRFERHPINTEFLDIMCSGRAAGRAERPAERAGPCRRRHPAEGGARAPRTWAGIRSHWKGEMTVKAMANLPRKFPIRPRPPRTPANASVCRAPSHGRARRSARLLEARNTGSLQNA
ncbi:MAG: oxygenase MpaB family protein [Hyphomonas sp.]